MLALDPPDRPPCAAISLADLWSRGDCVPFDVAEFFECLLHWEVVLLGEESKCFCQAVASREAGVSIEELTEFEDRFLDLVWHD